LCFKKKVKRVRGRRGEICNYMLKKIGKPFLGGWSLSFKGEKVPLFLGRRYQFAGREGGGKGGVYGLIEELVICKLSSAKFGKGGRGSHL